MELEEFNIEDITEFVAGQHNGFGSFDMVPRDKTVLVSIAKQTAKGTSLTDLQYNLLVKVLSQHHYSVQFENRGYSVASYLATLKKTRMDIREVDRSKVMTITHEVPSVMAHWTAPPGTKETETKQEQWIRLSFPFNKKHLASVSQFSKLTNDYVHTSGSRDHYFKLDEQVVYHLVKEFRYKDYVIDQELLDYFERLDYIDKHPEEYRTTVTANGLVNFHPLTEKYLLDRFGTPNKESIVQYKDHSIQFNISSIDESLLETAASQLSKLSYKLVHRNSVQVLARPDEWEPETVINSLVEIKRLPTLVILDTTESLRSLRSSFALFNQHVDAKDVSVLFRLSNDENPEFNQYVKDQGLNNPVSTNTKVVYICKDKLPKPLLKSEWKPESVLRMGSHRAQTKIDQWIVDCDLIIHYDKVASPWSPSNNAYTNYAQPTRRKIEKI